MAFYDRHMERHCLLAGCSIGLGVTILLYHKFLSDIGARELDFSVNLPVLLFLILGWE
jgi:hypothetical protein